MSEAARIRDTAEAAAVAHEAEIARLKAGREGVMAEARSTAEAERSAMLAGARAGVARERDAWKSERAEASRRHAASIALTGAEALLSLARRWKSVSWRGPSRGCAI